MNLAERQEIQRKLKAAKSASAPAPAAPSRESRDEAGRYIAMLGRRAATERRMRWPGGELEFVMRIPSVLELEEAKAKALRVVGQRLVDGAAPSALSIEDAIGVEEIIQTLAISLLNADTMGPLFPSAKQLGIAASEGEILVLFEMLVDFRDEVEPQIDDADDEVVDAFLEAVKKKDATTWRAIASKMRRGSLLSLVDLLLSSPQPRSSITSPSTKDGPRSSEGGNG